MNRKIIITGDGSATIQIDGWNETYHSKHGAIQEALYVFIDKGFRLCKGPKISILEMGFGSGLNAFITLMEADRQNLKVHYTTVEAFPVAQEEWHQLNYPEQLNAERFATQFEALHNSPWGQEVAISQNFTFLKRKQLFEDVADENLYSLIYFDAFGARVQPELWGESIFKKMYNALCPDGVLVTYASNSMARKAMLACGFLVEKLPGPPGKREMLRAKKP